MFIYGTPQYAYIPEQNFKIFGWIIDNIYSFGREYINEIRDEK